MEPNTLGNGSIIIDTDKEFKSGLITQSMRENGETTKQMAEVDSIMLTEMYMTVNGKTIKLMEKESILMQMGQSMMVNGLMISNMALVLNLGQMELGMKVITLTERKKEKGPFTLQTDQSSREILREMK